MLCVVCPHCQQVMSAADDAVSETVACPMCQKPLQVPANAPRLPAHLAGSAAVPAAALAHAAVGGAGGRAGAAVAAPPAPGMPPFAPAPQPARSTLPLGILVLGGAIAIVVAVVIFVVPKLGGKKTVVKGQEGEPVLKTHDPGPSTPPEVTFNPDDMKAWHLYKAYHDNSISADETFKDKEMTLTGVVAAVGGADGNLLVDLYGLERGRDETQKVRCLFTLAHRARLGAVKRGQPIRIHGTCKGKIDGRVVLRDCNLSE